MSTSDPISICPNGNDMDHGFQPSGLGLECLIEGACGHFVQPGEPGWDAAQSCYEMKNPGVVERAEDREARRAMLARMTFIAGQILDTIALFDQLDAVKTAELDPNDIAAAATIATQTRALAAGLKRHLASLAEES